MTNLLEDAAGILSQQLQDLAGVTISYKRGLSSVSLTATPITHEYKAIDDQGLNVVIRARDFIITAADLVLNLRTIEPQRGDQITYGDNRYEVMPIVNEPCFSPHDTFAKMIVIHSDCVVIG